MQYCNGEFINFVCLIASIVRPMVASSSSLATEVQFLSQHTCVDIINKWNALLKCRIINKMQYSNGKFIYLVCLKVVDYDIET